MAHVININSPDTNYGIVIESHLITEIEHHYRKYELGGRVAVVTNEVIAPLHGERLVNALPDATLITIPDGEDYKTMETVTDICRQFARNGLDRKSLVIALGGGVVGDTAGFAAASYMRGVTLVQMPTTLLSMVDSSVGGKVGVDIPEGKNLIGAFNQPDLVLIDTSVLETLPENEWKNGMAEVIKHAFLADEGLFNTALHTRAKAVELVSRAVQVKVDVIVQDPYENGIRAYLNLGHTFGHAIELVTQFAVPHGQGVSMGLMAAVKLSHRLGLCEESLIDRARDALVDVGLPITTGGIDSEAIYAAMLTDKKWYKGRSRFVLLRDIGDPLIMEGVSKDDVIAILDDMK